METQSQSQSQSQSVSISLSEAVKYAKLVDLADFVYKLAVANSDVASQKNPDISAYRAVLNNKLYKLQVDPDFEKQYKLLYNIQMLENSSPVYFGFIAQDMSTNDYVITFRGTETKFEDGSDEWFPPTSFNGFNNNSQVPQGFYNLYQAGVVSSLPNETIVFTALSSIASNPVSIMPQALTVRTVVAGHSLGAAVATYYAAAVSVGQGKDIDLSIYTYASPMTGDKTFTDTFNSKISKSQRVYNVPDDVPNLPKWPIIGTNIYTQVAEGYMVDSSKDPNVSTVFGCAHQLPVYQYLLEKLNGNKNPDILKAGGFCNCMV
jgi:predicted lipase